MKSHRSFFFGLSMLGSVAVAHGAPFEVGVELIRSPRPALTTEKTLPVIKGVDEGTSTQWQLSVKDKTLYTAMLRWAQYAQWQLIWEAERDFPIQVNLELEGDFYHAVSTVMNSLADSDYPLQAVMNPNTRVIRVIRYLQQRNS